MSSCDPSRRRLPRRELRLDRLTENLQCSRWSNVTVRNDSRGIEQAVIRCRSITPRLCNKEVCLEAPHTPQHGGPSAWLISAAQHRAVQILGHPQALRIAQRRTLSTHCHHAQRLITGSWYWVVRTSQR